MLPDVEMSYAQNHVRDISYYDYYQYGIKNIGSGESFNHLVSNGISNLKAVLLNLWDTLTTLMSWFEVLMFYTKIADTLTSNSTTSSFTSLESTAINPVV